MKKQLPADPLTPAEWIVMKAVWQLGIGTALEIHELTKMQQGWAVTTVKTLLSKLVQKQLLAVKEDGKRYLYRATQSSKKLLTKAADALLEKSMDEINGQLICYMVNKIQLSDTDIDELQSLLDEHKKKSGRKP